MGTLGEVLVILLLLVANGVFAMSEIAVVSARKVRLEQRAEAGNRGARRALELANAPDRFLATVQVGITLVGVLTGAFGGATLSDDLAAVLARTPALAPYAEELAFGLVVLAITYVSLVLGELVPKRIGLSRPERIAAAVARPMYTLSRLAHPAVSLLTVSTDVVTRILRIRSGGEPAVTEAEIAVLLEQGAEAGVIGEDEQEMVERVFWLGDRRAADLMTPRHRIVWIDAEAPADAVRSAMAEHRLSRYLVCEEELDSVLGMVDVRDLWKAHLSGAATLDLRAHLVQPLFVPESAPALGVLESFRETGRHLALVVDEWGSIAGLVTLNDVLEAIAGDLALPGEPAAPPIVRRDDGSLLVDASLGIDELRRELDLPERREAARGYRTVGGYVFTALGRVPTPGDHFDAEGWRIEVVDMDGNRIDKVLVTALSDPGGDDGDRDDG